PRCVSRVATSRRPGSRPRRRTRHRASRERHRSLGRFHAAHTPHRRGMVVGFECDHPCCSGSYVPFLYARLASSTKGFCKRRSRMAPSELLSWNVFSLGSARLATRCLRSRLVDGPHDPAPVADDLCSRVNPAGRTPTGFLAWLATTWKHCAWSPVSSAVRAPIHTPAFSARIVLDGFGVDASRMARAGTVYTGDAFGSVALCRTGFVFGSGISFLVAGCPALAGCRDRAPVVHPPVSLPCHGAVRHPLRISCVL